MPQELRGAGVISMYVTTLQGVQLQTSPSSSCPGLQLNISAQAFYFPSAQPTW